MTRFRGVFSACVAAEWELSAVSPVCRGQDPVCLSKKENRKTSPRKEGKTERREKSAVFSPFAGCSRRPAHRQLSLRQGALEQGFYLTVFCPCLGLSSCSCFLCLPKIWIIVSFSRLKRDVALCLVSGAAASLAPGSRHAWSLRAVSVRAV